MLDFDATDAIFSEPDQCHETALTTEPAATAGGAAAGAEREEPAGAKSSSSGSECSCAACHNRTQMEAEKRAEVERLRQCWVEVRDQIWRVYHNVLSNQGSGADAAARDKASGGDVDMVTTVKPKVHELCCKDPHQLFQRLETGIRDIVVGIKLKLIELLQKQAKNPSLAQEFIQSEHIRCFVLSDIFKFPSLPFQACWRDTRSFARLLSKCLPP